MCDHRKLQFGCPDCIRRAWGTATVNPPTTATRDSDVRDEANVAPIETLRSGKEIANAVEAQARHNMANSEARPVTASTDSSRRVKSLPLSLTLAHVLETHESVSYGVRTITTETGYRFIDTQVTLVPSSDPLGAPRRRRESITCVACGREEVLELTEKVYAAISRSTLNADVNRSLFRKLYVHFLVRLLHWSIFASLFLTILLDATALHDLFVSAGLSLGPCVVALHVWLLYSLRTRSLILELRRRPDDLVALISSVPEVVLCRCITYVNPVPPFSVFVHRLRLAEHQFHVGPDDLFTDLDNADRRKQFEDFVFGSRQRPGAPTSLWQRFSLTRK